MSQVPRTGQASRAGLRLMHVHAHPDDESSKGAASTAMYVAQGVDVHVATCTGGERGSILNPKMDRPDILENITEIRRQEMERARDILGVRQDWLGFVDSGWPEGDPKPPLPEGCFALVPLEESAEHVSNPTLPPAPTKAWALGSRYELHHRIGGGASGQVWAGRRRDDDLPVAVKVLRRELSEDPQTVDRFLRESRLLQSVRHPNIVRIHDFVKEAEVSRARSSGSTPRFVAASTIFSPCSSVPDTENASSPRCRCQRTSVSATTVV